MEDKMNIYYDEEGDYLEIASGDISNCYVKVLKTTHLSAWEL